MRARLDAVAGAARPGAARRSRSRRSARSSAPVRQLEFGDALVNTAIVVALYVFVGNSGVISFGHISFVAVGAYLSGILTLGAEQKNFVIPTMFPFLRHTHTSTAPSLALAAAAGAVFALVVGVPLMRLSGLPGRHRDLRGARHHLQRHQLLGQDRPRA